MSHDAAALEAGAWIGRQLSLRDLRILLTTAEAGSMSKAAALLRVSQPAVSKAIGHIESVVGVPLIKRTSRGVEPTVYGLALLSRSRSAFDELMHGIDAMGALSDPTTGEIRVAASQGALSAIVPKVINLIYMRYPGIVFNVVPAYTRADQVRELDQRNVELVVGRTAVPVENAHLEVSELIADPFVVVAGRDNPWKRRKNIQLPELMNEHWTFPPLDTLSGRSMSQIFQASGLDLPRIAVIASSLLLHRQLIVHSGFMALMPASVARSMQSISVLPVSLKGERQCIGILTVKDRSLSPLAKLFIESAREVVRGAPEG